MSDERASRDRRPGEVPENGWTSVRRKRVIAPEVKTRALFFVRLRWFVPPLVVVSAALARALGFQFNLACVIGVAGFTLSYNAVLYVIGKREDGYHSHIC